MSWQEPGNNGSKDPWGKKRSSDAPPDLDQLLKQLQKKLSKVLNGGHRGGGGFKVGPEGGGSSFAALWMVLAVLLVLWALAGVYTVKAGEEAAVLRFGKYHRTELPGIHWLPRIFDKKYMIDVQKISAFDYKSLMLTEDENIVSVSVAVQYRIDNISDYLFNVVNPVESLQQATASALRQVIGHSTLDQILTTGRETVRQQIYVQLNKILKPYRTGLLVTEVVMQPARPPEEVKAAFDDAIAAQEDEQRYINRAQAYANGVVPLAKGQATRHIADADAYRAQVVLKAEADAARFLALLPEHKRAPKVMEQRLYLQSLEQVLDNTSKVFVDTRSGSNNLLYLPIDKLMAQPERATHTAEAGTYSPTERVHTAPQSAHQTTYPYRADRSQHRR